jgi:hypothetical protein
MYALQRLRRQRDKVLYYTSAVLGHLVPAAFARRASTRILRELDGIDEAALSDRVDYYCALPRDSALGPGATAIGSFADRQRWTYYLDLRSTLVHFAPELRFHYLFGDNVEVPAHPSFTKSRPLGADNRSSVLLKLNRIRHFRFVEDRTPFLAKRPVVVWRGDARKHKRHAALARLHAHPRCDVGHAGDRSPDPAWRKPWLPIRDQLRCRYLLCVEGNDVATGLKWGMSSNSLCLMTRPSCETWFMEGRLVPGVHYVELAPDYSDLDLKLDHYEAHPDEAQWIIRNAHAHVDQFRDPRIERLVSLLVACRYFERTGQADLLPAAYWECRTRKLSLAALRSARRLLPETQGR